MITTGLNEESNMVKVKSHHEVFEEDESLRFRGQISYDKDENALFVKDYSLLTKQSHSTSNEENEFNINNNNCLHVSLPQFQNGVTSFDEVINPKYLAVFYKSSALSNSSSLSKISGSQNSDDADLVFSIHSVDNLSDLNKFSNRTTMKNEECSDIPERKPLLMCFACQLTFAVGTAFAGHVVNCHGLDLSDKEINLFEENNVSAVLQKVIEDCHLWYMQPSNEIKKDATTLQSTKRLKVVEDFKSRVINDKNFLESSKKKSEVDKSDVACSVEASQDNSSSSLATFEPHQVLISTESKKANIENPDPNSPTIVPNTNDQSASTARDDSSEKILDLSAAVEKNISLITSSSSLAATVAKQSMLGCQTMPYAVASPLDGHAQSPTSRSLMLGGVKANGLNIANFLSRRKDEEEMAQEENNFVLPAQGVKISQISTSAITSSKQKSSDSSSFVYSVSTNTSSSAASKGTPNPETPVKSSTNVDPMFPMSLFQSRNSCKTLKCPKCNWHYKYRQTLEAHMKEKHFDETSDCVYCNAGQPHPRLSRGESYSCGYKPFKCNVCNYSTTTKGNLSIHMQSDKHLYNVRSMQRQQERIRQGNSNASNFSQSSSQNSEGKQSQNEQSIAKQNSSPLTEYNGSSLDRNLQMRRRRSSSKTNSSVDSGIFSSTSKAETSSIAGVRRDSSSISGGKYRCDVCCYETGIARNLRIHMTSEKHAQNVAINKKGISKDAQRNRSERNQAADTSQITTPSLLDYYTAAFKQLQQNGAEAGDISTKALPLADDVRKVHTQYLQHQLFLAQQQQLILVQQYQQLMMAAAATSLQQQLSQSVDAEANDSLTQPKHQQEFSQNSLWKQFAPQQSGDSSAITHLNTKQANLTMANHSSNIFSCGLCCVFGTDDFSKLETHVRMPRHMDVVVDPTCNEWVVKTRNREKENYHCKLCSYSTPLKTNFNLHCKTEKHTCKLNLVCHVKEGGAATSWMIPLIIRGNLPQNVSCNACQFVTHSFEKLKIHCGSEQHQTIVNLCQYLQEMLRKELEFLNEEKEYGKSFQYRCLVCSNLFTTKDALEMARHVRSAEHQTEFQSLKTPPSSIHEVVTVEQEALPNSYASKEAKTTPDEDVIIQCEYCNYSCADKARMQMHVLSQHSDHPPTPCPLCQELLKSPLQLRLHLLQEHQLQVSPVDQKNASDQSGEQTSTEVSSREKVYCKGDEINKEKMDVECDIQVDSELVIDENFHSENCNKNDDDTSTGPGRAKCGGDDPKNNGDDGESSKSLFIARGRDFGSKEVFEKEEKSSSEPEVAQNSKEQQESPQDFKMLPNNKNLPLTESVNSDCLIRSCPNLTEPIKNPMARSFSGKVRCRKSRRFRMRSFSINSSSKKSAYHNLLSKYGLEQAQHYIENRSSRNKTRARTYRLAKIEPTFSASLSEPDATEKEAIISEASSTTSVRKKNSSDAESELEDESLTCVHCGKEFSGLWVLKTHEEVAHGVFVPTKNIENLADAYTDNLTQNQVQAEKNEKSKTKEEEERPVDSLSQKDDQKNPLNDLLNQNLDQMTLLQQQQQQQFQNQSLLQTLMKMQAIKQSGVVENEINRNFSPEDMHLRNLVNDSSSFSSNILSQLGMYSTLLQTQALGMHPYQMLSNAAVLQQLQHLANPTLLELSDVMSPRGTSNVFPNSIPGLQTLSFQNQHRANKFENSSKQDSSGILDTTTSVLPGSQHNQQSFDMPTKRPRTRISDDQLKILRANFDINNSPSEDQVDEMAQRTGLPPKVIKHWFRNTLFKERQRSKDSPYNFNIPPVLSIEDAQKPSTIKHENSSKISDSLSLQEKVLGSEINEINSESPYFDTTLDKNPLLDRQSTDVKRVRLDSSNNQTQQLLSMKGSSVPSENFQQDLSSTLFANALSLVPSLSPKEVNHGKLEESRDNPSMLALSNLSKQILNNSPGWPNITGFDNLNTTENLYYDSSVNPDNISFPTLPSSGICRRTPRTRFTDFQLQVLQEFFDHNAYPKDDDLDKLSQTLNLSTRVIVVWFQNARQKARKSYEQQQQASHLSPPSNTDHMRNQQKLSDRLGITGSSKISDDLSAKSIVEASKNLTETSSFNSTRSANEKKDSGSFAIPSGLASVTVKKEADLIENNRCHPGEKEFTISDWQLQQQEHLKSMLDQYGQMYAKSLGENIDQAEKSKTEINPNNFQSNSPAKFGSNTQTTVQRNTVQISDASEENRDSGSLAALSKMLSNSQSNPVQSNSSVSSLVDAAQSRSDSSSAFNSFPTLSKMNLTSNTDGFSNKMNSFGEDKESNGLQKDPKRLRTTITPEQLEYLYQQYLFDSSPSRKVIEQISEVVGLKKRVVQVWFQNTRARERKGQFRSSIARCLTGQMTQHKLCQLCRMVFRTKEELDHHIFTKHQAKVTPEPTQYTLEGPAEKKLKLSTEQSSEILSGIESKPSLYQSVKSIFDAEQLKASNHNLSSMIPASLSVAQLKSDCANASDPDTERSSGIGKDLESSAIPLSSALNFHKLLEKGVNFSLLDPKSNQSASIYSGKASQMQGLQAILAKNSELFYPVDNENRKATSSVQERKESPATGKSQSFSLHTVKEETKPCDTSQPNSTTLSSVPSMVLGNSLLDMSSTPSKRHRTQMSSAQVRALKHCYKAFKTPSLTECELIGNEIGLQKRVVQVWFQNTRAKEKKQKMKQTGGTSYLDQSDLTERDEIPKQCDLCIPPVTHSSAQLARQHYFSLEHLQRLMSLMEKGKKEDGDAGSSFSHGSPYSSHDSSETPSRLDSLGSDLEANSPTSKSNQELPTSPVNSFGEINSTALTNNPVQEVQKQNSSSFTENEPNPGKPNSYREPAVGGYSQLFASNPSLFQHYQKALQLLTQQQQQIQQGNSAQSSTGSLESQEQQAIFQQALQQSLYQILKLPQTSTTENQ